MNILLTGVNYNNKGAELMLRAMIQHLRGKFPQARLVCGFNETYENRVREGLYQFALRSRGRVVRCVEWLPQKTRYEWGIILPKEIDVVLDASGFAFGDQWKEPYVRSEANRRLQCKQWGAKLILLPQAFGPFENPQIKSICSELFTQADLIFPRDNRSYQYVNALLPASEGTKKVHLAPDFTNIVQGFVPKSFDSTLHGAVEVLPNEKMIAKKGEEEAKKYLDFLVHSIRSLREKNIPHFILAHQQQDKKVIDLLRTQIDPFPEVVTESNALFIKGILGTCRFLIGSRFHGLVNGLSQGVPCICTSWSHKYEALFEDYHCSDFLISDLSALNQVDQLILRLSDETTYRSIRENIETQSSRIKEETKTLWGIVDTFLQNNIH